MAHLRRVPASLQTIRTGSGPRPFTINCGRRFQWVCMLMHGQAHFPTACQTAVVLMTPDDEARLRDQFHEDGDPPHDTEVTPQARPNVLFEAGMAMAWDEDRTVLVELGNCRPFSDIGGHYLLRMNNSTGRRQELAERLQAAGAAASMSGTDWHRAGDFSIPS